MEKKNISSTPITPESPPTQLKTDLSVSLDAAVRPEIQIVAQKPKSEITMNCSGDKIVKKNDGKQAQKEVCASNLYNYFGVKTPEMKLIGYDFDPRGAESKFIEGLKEIPADDMGVYKKISEDFALDALLGNNNILDSCKIDSGNNVIRVNLKNILGVENGLELGHFGAVVEEISSFLNPNKNPQNARVYSVLTRENFIDSVDKLAAWGFLELRDSFKVLYDGAEFLNKKKCSFNIAQRLNFLKTVSEIAKKTEQEALSIFEYADKVKNDAIAKTVNRANSYTAILDLERAISNIENNDTKTMLLELLQNRKSFLNKNDNTKISMYEIGDLLKDFTFKKYKANQQESSLIKEKYGEYNGGRYLYSLGNITGYSEIFSMQEIANKNNGKYLDFWKNNPEKMALYINSKTTTHGQLVKFDDAAWDVVIGYYKSFFDRNFGENEINAIVKYGGLGSSDSINGLLRIEHKIIETLAQLKSKTEFGLKDIKLLNQNIAYIEKLAKEKFFIGTDWSAKDINQKLILQKLSNIQESLENVSELDSELQQKLKLDLTEFKDFLLDLGVKNKVVSLIDSLKKIAVVSTNKEQNLRLNRNDVNDIFSAMIYNDKNLSELMSQSREDTALRTEILKYFNETNPSLFQSGFLSNSIYPYSTLRGNVNWNLKMDENVKYSYISDFDHIFGHANERTEAEILVSPGHKIRILGAKFEDSKWYMEGIILPE